MVHTVFIEVLTIASSIIITHRPQYLLRIAINIIQLPQIVFGLLFVFVKQPYPEPIRCKIKPAYRLTVIIIKQDTTVGLVVAHENPPDFDVLPQDGLHD